MIFNITRILAVLGVFLHPAPSLSDDSRFEILFRTDKLAKLNERGQWNWDIEVTNDKIIYTCISCEAKTIATLEATPASGFDSPIALENTTSRNVRSFAPKLLLQAAVDV